MAFIEANITINLPDDVDASALVEQIRMLLSSISDKETNISVIEVDDPISTNPIYTR
jgi:hypothetical protein